MAENSDVPAPNAPVQDVRTLDPRSLRGLAHPLRMRLLIALRHHGPATASRLADRLGESSGATSYHLRQLASHGFVTDDPERGKGRERWWKAEDKGIMLDDALHLDPDPEVRGALNTFFYEVASIHGQEVSTWLGTMHDWPEVWATKADLSDFTLRLTPDLLAELESRVHDLISSYEDLPVPEGAESVAQVRVHLHALPQKRLDTPDA
ncbi:transcriptional regulator [Streptomyces camponoticapitis]|uniref:Transcriptional regulator n=1 Tax=Streptomyces camponoticapitis TaxID=1616125 RepID=A0ABQ2E295_9ACTN|nr:helix-turn-helix domain-containing protein [Streptomyces camponoticapitis]GGJ87519.1 transcriptional regulator [Streptomyces camponoticapitis]